MSATLVPPMPRGGEAFGAYWDEAAAQAATTFFATKLRHTEGEWAARPFVLQPWQRDQIIRPVFGWKRADHTRLIRIVWLEVPRKNGKTELAAGISLIMLLGDGEISAQVYSIAVDKKQASIVFRKAGVMVGMSAVLRRHLEVLKTAIFCQQTNGSFAPLSGTVQGKHGLSANGVVGDEVHEWTDGELADAVHKSTVARGQPLEFYITTAGVAGQGHAAEMHDLAMSILAGEVTDPTFLPVIFAAPSDAPINLESTWRAANPNYGISVKASYMREEAEKAVRSPRAENAFRRYHLNQWTEQVTRWLPMGEDGWKGCTAEPTNTKLWQQLPERLRGRRCFGGVDLAITRDITSSCLCFPPEQLGERFRFLWRFWLPEQAVEDQPLARRRRYESFVAAGALTLTPGNVTDYGFVEAALLSDAKAYKLLWLGSDPYNASDLMVRLQTEHGLPVQMHRQGMLSMSPPTKGFERLVMGSGLEHGSNPVATWMARNAVVETDAAGNIKPTKAKAADKIDGIVAAIMAYGGATLGAVEEPKASKYETGGLVMVG